MARTEPSATGTKAQATQPATMRDGVPQPAPGGGMIRVSVTREIPLLLREFNLDPDPILSEAGVDPRLLDDPDNLIPFTAMGRLIGVCVARTGCPHFGLLVGQRGGAWSLGAVGLLLRQAPDVGAALADLVKYLHLHDRGAVARLAVASGTGVLSYTIYQSVESADQIADGAVAIGVKLMRGLCGADWRPTEVLLPHRKPADVTPFTRFFQAPLRFDAEEAALAFSAECLDRPLAGADPTLHRLIQDHVRQLENAQSDHLPDQVRRLLRTLLVDHHCSAESIAHLFAVDRRTLNRRLRRHGTGFRTLLEEVRFQIARQLMSDTRLPLTQIAAALDYAEASAFTRAFRRWSGVSPTEWRARHSQG